MKTYLHLKNEHKRILPEKFRNEDVRYTEDLVKYFIEHFTKENDVVFDPFAGWGTTLHVTLEPGFDDHEVLHITPGKGQDIHREHQVIDIGIGVNIIEIPNAQGSNSFFLW